MVWEDTRKTIRGNGILEIGTKPPNPSRNIKWRVFYHWGTSKKGSLHWNYVGEGFRLKQLLLYLSKSIRVFFFFWLICGSRTQGQPCIRKVKVVYTGPSPRTHSTRQKHILPRFKHSFHFLQPKGSSKTYSKHEISSIQEAKLYRNIQLVIYLVKLSAKSQLKA